MNRFVHASIFVDDLSASIAFHTEELGLKLLGEPHHYPGNADMAFVVHSWDAYVELDFDLEGHPPYALVRGSNTAHSLSTISTRPFDTTPARRRRG